MYNNQHCIRTYSAIFTAQFEGIRWKNPVRIKGGPLYSVSLATSMMTTCRCSDYESWTSTKGSCSNHQFTLNINFLTFPLYILLLGPNSIFFSADFFEGWIFTLHEYLCIEERKLFFLFAVWIQTNWFEYDTRGDNCISQHGTQKTLFLPFFLSFFRLVNSSQPEQIAMKTKTFLNAWLKISFGISQPTKAPSEVCMSQGKNSCSCAVSVVESWIVAAFSMWQPRNPATLLCSSEKAQIQCSGRHHVQGV